MTFTGDPYAALGLARGASLDEVKRAYRTLAKRYHPDSAGEAATPRFLAIQAAYEAITGPSTPRRGGAEGTSAAGTPPPSRPSAADQERARATREAYRSRRTWGGANGTTGSAGTGTSSGPGASAGAPPRTGPASGPSDRRGESPRSGTTGSKEGTATGRRRAQRVASLGSTSYDDATEWEPEWSGGTWYGTSSGTHWTVNPKEYADPRKHGPEYLARARRRVEQAAGRDRAGDTAADGSTTSTAEGPTPPPPDEPAASRTSRPDEHDGPRPDSADPLRPGASRAAYRARRDASTPPRVAFAGEPSPPAGAGGSAAWVAAAAEASSSVPARLLAALIAWPPLGYLAAFSIGEVSGCARYAAGCTDEAAIAMWGIQPVVVAILLLLPIVARPAAVGSIALLVAAVPAAAALSASAGNRGPSPETVGLFVAIIVMAYVVAAVGAATGRLPLPAWLRSPDD